MNARRKTVDDALEFIAAVARKQGFKVNPDGEFVGDIATGLATNYNRHGYYLCPCRDGDGERDTDRDIICPCAYSLQDLAVYGHCFCGLFFSGEFALSGRGPESIPERRPGGI